MQGKKHHKNSSLLFVLVNGFIILFITASLYSETTAFDFLDSDPGARSSALAGASSSVQGDPWAGFYNIAETSFIKKAALSMTHYLYLEESYYLGLAFNYPFSSKFRYLDTISAGVLYKYHDFIITDESGNETAEHLFPRDYCFLLGGSSRIIKDLHAGLAVKYLFSSIDIYSAKTIALDMGLAYKNILWQQPCLVSLSVQNIGSKIKYINREESLPLTVRVNSSYRVIEAKIHSINISMTAEKILYQGIYIMAGYEHMIKKIFVYRIGYNLVSDNNRWLALGCGIKVNNLFIDYSYQPLIKFNNMHQVSLGYNF